jgi:NAD(P)-dependent dehydrogenase (short-subunit alcohol dehydrogenase family)
MDFEEQIKKTHPMQRFGRHEELANLAVYLLSPQAEYINGECVVIDGAQWLRRAATFSDLLDLPDSAWRKIEQARAAG